MRASGAALSAPSVRTWSPVLRSTCPLVVPTASSKSPRSPAGGPRAKRWKLSVRRACALLTVARSSARYASKRQIADAPVVRRTRELAAQYPCHGYRRIRIFLGRDGHVMSVDRAHRLWRTSRLQVPRKRPRRGIASTRPPTDAARRSQPRLGVRLRLRRVRRRQAAQVPRPSSTSGRASARQSTSPAASALGASSTCSRAS